MDRSRPALDPGAPVFVLTGATGTGKTEVSLELASRLGAEILCADSRQLYRGLDCATGKPTAIGRARVPHHGFDVLDVGEASSAGQYARNTRAWIEEIDGRDRLSLLVGGTGLYLRGLHRGLADVPAIPSEVRERLRSRLEEEGAERLHAELARHDPPLAARLAPRDGQRVARGLEVALATGRPLSAWHAGVSGEPPTWFWVALTRPRAVLAQSLAERARRFFEQGLLEEVGGLLAKGALATDPGFDALGYREALDVLAGHTTLEDAIALLARHTAQYAKRQETWFRGEARRVEIVFREWNAHESPGQLAKELAERYTRFALERSGRPVSG